MALVVATSRQETADEGEDESEQERAAECRMRKTAAGSPNDGWHE